jgi:hypothetical protein
MDSQRHGGCEGGSQQSDPVPTLAIKAEFVVEGVASSGGEPALSRLTPGVSGAPIDGLLRSADIFAQFSSGEIEVAADWALCCERAMASFFQRECRP